MILFADLFSQFMFDTLILQLVMRGETLGDNTLFGFTLSYGTVCPYVNMGCLYCLSTVKIVISFDYVNLPKISVFIFHVRAGVNLSIPSFLNLSLTRSEAYNSLSTEMNL